MGDFGSTVHDDGQLWKVGALAGLTGLTVRALHHYDHIGLLVPSQRSASGHRLYTGADVARLYRICVLRGLGFSLEQVGEVFDDPQWQIKQTVARHLEDTRRRAVLAADLADRLSRMAHALDESDSPTATDYQSPQSVGAATGMTVINVDDADTHYRNSVAAGATVIEEPVDQPYGVREWGARDLEGQLWFFHSPLT